MGLAVAKHLSLPRLRTYLFAMALTWIPNTLTLARCGLAVVSAAAVIAGERLSQRLDAAVADWQAVGAPAPGSPGYPELLSSLAPADLLFWPMIALVAFMLAALTDLLDGILARALEATSAFGARLDPIADKVLVGLVLVSLAITSRSLWLMVPAAIIITRDSYITWLRSKLGGEVALPVAVAAKWKTGLEMIAIGMLLGLPLLASVSHDVMVSGVMTAGEMVFLSLAAERIGITLTWIAAGLSVWTGLNYWKSAQSAPIALKETFE